MTKLLLAIHATYLRGVYNPLVSGQLAWDLGNNWGFSYLLGAYLGRDINSERRVDPTSIAPVPGVDEIETLRKGSPSRKTHGFARLGHRAGKSRGGYATRQRPGCRQFHALAQQNSTREQRQSPELLRGLPSRDH